MPGCEDPQSVKRRGAKTNSKRLCAVTKHLTFQRRACSKLQHKPQAPLDLGMPPSVAVTSWRVLRGRQQWGAPHLTQFISNLSLDVSALPYLGYSFLLPALTRQNVLPQHSSSVQAPLCVMEMGYRKLI